MTTPERPELTDDELRAMSTETLTALALSKLDMDDFKAVSAARWAAQHGASPFWQQSDGTA